MRTVASLFLLVSGVAWAGEPTVPPDQGQPAPSQSEPARGVCIPGATALILSGLLDSKSPMQSALQSDIGRAIQQSSCLLTPNTQARPPS